MVPFVVTKVKAIEPVLFWFAFRTEGSDRPAALAETFDLP